MRLVGQQPEEQATSFGPIDYGVWNAALAAAFFNPDRSGQMVYLDKDDEAFAAAYVSLGLESADAAVESLTQAVAGKLCWRHSGRETFAEFDMLTRRWVYERKVARAKKQPVKAPPLIALLMVLSIAAEKMQSSSHGAADGAGSYYAQLERTLGIAEAESKRLRFSFMISSEAYWEALSVWLEDFAGENGLPSAYALMFRYVGLPISQALIRDTERRNIDRFFEEQGFIPGTALSHAEMFAALDVWLTVSGSSANQALRLVWAKAANQDRVTELALAQFAAWQGPKVVGPRSTVVSRTLRCVLSWRNERKFLKTTANFGLVVTQGVPEDRAGRVLGADGGESRVTFKPAGNNTYGVSFEEHRVDAGSLLGSPVTIITSDDQSIRRMPKRIAIFIRDTLTASYVEVDRMVAGSETRILVKADPKLVDQVEEILKDTTDGSYRAVQGGKDGIPEGWVAYVDVISLRAPNPKLVEHTDFAAFEPRLTTQMSVQGGLRLPGRTRRWSAIAPMSLVITSEDSKPVELYRIDRDPESLRTSDVLLQEKIIPPVKLNVHALADGQSDFSLSLRRGSKTLQNMQIKLRHADSDDSADPEQLRSIAHAVGTPLWPLKAIESAASPTGWVMGSEIDAPAFEEGNFELEIPKKVSWSGPRNFGLGRPVLLLPKPGEKSCIETGAHRFNLPTFDGKYPKTQWMYAHCELCGLSKRYPTRIKDARKKEYLDNRSRQRLPHISGSRSIPNLTALLDTLMFLGEGTRKDFSMLARQLEDSALFERQLLMSLEALAFIEVERDVSMEVIAWESVYQCVAGTDNGEWLLTGPWSEHLVEELTECVESAGGSSLKVDAGPFNVVHFTGLTPRALTSALEDYTNADSVTPFSGRKLADALPPLSQIVQELPRTAFPFAQEYEYFHVENAQWIPSEFAQIPGLYRLPRVHGSGYYLRTQTDIAEGKSAKVWAELGKHLAANILRRPLMSYHPSTKKLQVPLGAELPGLYGRAAVLASGKLPEAQSRINSVIYSGISPETAVAISRKVMS
ncbi:hypothetical protein ACTXIU_11740 [Glutamicibacter arilaitensis]|uniref:hypothetical protein n=1 Tax=Glutamicibacter arilaitensis TaxID=256701 RepID=UPI003FD197BF